MNGLNLSARDRRALLWLVISVAAIVLVNYKVFPLLDAAGDSTGSIEIREKRLHQYQNVAALVPAHETNVATLSDALTNAETGLLSGATPALQVAEMQEMTRNAASAQAIVVRSVEFIPPKNAGSGYLLVGVSLNFTAGVDQVVALMNAMQNGPKILAVDQLRIDAANVPASPKDPGKKQVSVSMQVYGVARGPEVPKPDAPRPDAPRPDASKPDAPKQEAPKQEGAK